MFIVFIVLNSLLGDYFYPNYLLTEEFTQHSFIYKVLYSVATLKLKIYTYFTAFMLMETTSIASGLSYDGIDENCNPLFDV
jgi:hypothetical protein